MEIGHKVEHILSKDWLLVLEVSDEYVLCRTKDMRAIKFRPFEVREIK